MSRARAIVLVVLLLLSSLLAILFSGKALSRLREEPLEEETLLLRPDRLPGIHLGLKGSLAGILWLRHINYFGSRVMKRSLTQETYRWLAENLEGIIRLEPQFSDPPLFASDVLAFFGDRVSEAHRLLLLGLTGQSLSWQIYFRLGVIYMRWYGDYPGAGEWWKFAALSPHSPFWLPGLVQLTLLRYTGEVEEGIVAVMERRFPVPELEEEWKLIRRFVEELKVWNQDLKRFRERYHRPPRDLTELVEAGIWEEVPRDPWGGEIRLSRDGERLVGSERVPVFFRERERIPIPPELRSGAFLRELRYPG